MKKVRDNMISKELKEKIDEFVSVQNQMIETVDNMYLSKQSIIKRLVDYNNSVNEMGKEMAIRRSRKKCRDLEKLSIEYSTVLCPKYDKLEKEFMELLEKEQREFLSLIEE